MNDFAKQISLRLKDNGFDAVRCVSDATDSNDELKNAVAVFSIGNLFLRFVRDRNQVFLDISSTYAPDKFYQFDDIEVAMGLKRIEQILEKDEPEDLNVIFNKLGEHILQLDSLMSPEQARFMLKRIDHVAKERGIMFVNRLNEKSKKTPE